MIPKNGTDLAQGWIEELRELGFTPRILHRRLQAGCLALPSDGSTETPVVDLVLSRLGGRRSGWNPADIRGETERVIASVAWSPNP